MKTFYTPKELARELGVSVKWVIHQINRGEIPVMQNYNRPYLIPATTLTHLMHGELRHGDNRRSKR